MQTGSRDNKPSSVRRRTTLSGAIAIASATGLIPLTSKSAIALSEVDSHHLPTSSQQTPTKTKSASAASQAQVIAPQTDQSQQAIFSQHGVDQHKAPISTSPKTAASQIAAASEDEQGSWLLAYQVNTPSDLLSDPARADSAVQTVIARIAAESTAAACRDSVCRRLAHIDSQLPLSTKRVGVLEQQLKDFASRHGKGDMRTYQTVLSDRISEISNQKRQLTIELDQTRSQARRLRSQLSYANSLTNIEADIAERVLNTDADYQKLWNRLKIVEANIQKEYSQVNTDGTALNQLYANYQALLEKTQVAAQVALSRYPLTGSQTASSQTASNPAAIHYRHSIETEILENLVLETHQRNVQQLRIEKIALIEAALMDRHRRLSETIGEYENIQRALDSERRIVESYRSKRAQILTESPVLASTENAPADTARYTAQSTLNARALMATLPDGSMAKTLLGIVIAASLVATMTHRSSEKKAAALGKRILEIVPTSSVPIRHIATQLQTPSLVNARAANPSFCIVNALGEFEISESAAISPDEVIADIETDRVLDDIEAATFDKSLDEVLDKAIDKTSSQALSTQEISRLEVAPIRLPVEEINSFVEKAVEWVLKDLGLEILAADAANRKFDALA